MRRRSVCLSVLVSLAIVGMICSCSDGPVTPSVGEDGPAWVAWNDPFVISYQLDAVWGRTADDIYAVGSDEVVLHCDGGEWSVVHHGGAGTTTTAAVIP